MRPFGSVTAVEINATLAASLEQVADETICGDFLEQNGNLGTFDRILMNPPFQNGADIKHIQHAMKMLKPGGRLIAICANGPRQQTTLKPLAENSGGWYEDLPAGTLPARNQRQHRSLAHRKLTATQGPERSGPPSRQRRRIRHCRRRPLRPRHPARVLVVPEHHTVYLELP